jgi:hypothetical protein
LVAHTWSVWVHIWGYKPTTRVTVWTHDMGYRYTVSLTRRWCSAMAGESVYG